MTADMQMILLCKLWLGCTWSKFPWPCFSAAIGFLPCNCSLHSCVTCILLFKTSWKQVKKKKSKCCWLDSFSYFSLFHRENVNRFAMKGLSIDFGSFLLVNTFTQDVASVPYPCANSYWWFREFHQFSSIRMRLLRGTRNKHSLGWSDSAVGPQAALS